VLAELRHMEADLAALGGALEGVVNVGALPFARTTLLPDAVVALHAMHPRLCTRTFEKTYQELCAGLLDGQIDFIVGPVRVARLAGLNIEVLFTQGLSLIARAGHPLASKRRLCAADLAGFPWALSRRGTPLREEVNDLFSDLDAGRVGASGAPHPASDRHHYARRRAVVAGRTDTAGRGAAPVASHRARGTARQAGYARPTPKR
jgi:DNA-binding transcriptional LysR family regulator